MSTNYYAVRKKPCFYSCQNNKRNQDNPDNFKYSKNIDGYRFTDR